MKTLYIFSYLTVLSLSSGAETLSFEQIWDRIQSASIAQDGIKLKTQSLELGLDRSKQYLIPELYVDAKSYGTNDPAATFVGLLEQRKVNASDFNPDSLNRPDSQVFTRASLGLGWSLYEGGSSLSQVNMYQHLLRATQNEAKQLSIDQFAGAGSSYATYLSSYKNKINLNDLNDEILKLIKTYQLAQKSNPVGYSGFLGLRSLSNRIKALLDILKAQENSSLSTLVELGVKDTNWQPQLLEVKDFLEKYFALPSQRAQSPSYKIQKEISITQASFESAKIEKSRYLPSVGIFAESQLFNGSRSTSDNYVAGIYLKWSIFNPSQHSRYDEARVMALARDKMNLAEIQDENAVRIKLQETYQALLSNLVLLEESKKILLEQTRISYSLFKSGSINALQLAEILNRHIDLIRQQSDVELNLIQTATEQARRFQISTK